MRAIWIALLGVAVLAGSASGATKGGSIALVAYSTPKDAYGQIISAFQKTKAGNGTNFSQSYGASGDQARAVAAGQPADLVALSLAPDIDLLAKKGLVARNWAANAHKGIVSDSVVVFVVRDGNPKHIKGWGDLIKPGVQVITPNPFTSGGARWNVMAAYGAERKAGKTDKQAIAYVERMMRNVVSLDTSGRNATNSFLAGRGDVFITYENEARLAKLQYVIPRQTLLIEAPIAVIKTSDNKGLATKFVRFTRTPQAQRIFAQYGFRPLLPSVYREFEKQYPKRPGIFEIGDRYIGGWKAVEKRWFDPDKGLWVGIAKRTGLGT